VNKPHAAAVSKRFFSEPQNQPSSRPFVQKYCPTNGSPDRRAFGKAYGSFYPTTRSPPMDKIRLGIVGLGGIGQPTRREFIAPGDAVAGRLRKYPGRRSAWTKCRAMERSPLAHSRQRSRLESQTPGRRAGHRRPSKSVV